MTETRVYSRDSRIMSAGRYQGPARWSENVLSGRRSAQVDARQLAGGAAGGSAGAGGAGGVLGAGGAGGLAGLGSGLACGFGWGGGRSPGRVLP